MVLQHQCFGDPADIHKAVDIHRQAATLGTNSHTRKAQYLSNFGVSLDSKCKFFGEGLDLENAILAHPEAVDLTSTDDVALPGRLSNFGICL
ncbi:hypothetical protein M422DRAFT_177345 [Sphaerobolus stellatus SS14]|uniref:Uncharacterized protein n=1 Tax=Sphaerobolus stellatus (strain SS14) TaxID=990650 RepID=A0A0C9VKF2_SPHS4|nr:hypothetical protein M422DRAFT_177345 [Sphaerobolus stellatus SS14]